MLEKLFTTTSVKKLKFNAAGEIISVDELIKHAHKVTESCIHLDQVMITRDFVMNVAKRCARKGDYSMDDVWRVGMVVNSIAESKVRRILAVEYNHMI